MDSLYLLYGLEMKSTLMSFRHDRTVCIGVKGKQYLNVSSFLCSLQRSKIKKQIKL